WTLADWCDQCHRKAGLVVWTGSQQLLPESTTSVDDEPAESPFNCVGGEALANLLLARVDAVELDMEGWTPSTPAPIWYDLLNLGYRIPLVGASRKHDAT